MRAPHQPGEGGGEGADAGRARAHTHTKDTRGKPEGQPDRARGTHTPHGMAYQQARIRDTQTHRFLIYDLSVNSESQLFRFQIISHKVTVEEIGKLIVNFLFPKSLWFEFHRQSRTVPACNCRGTDRRKMKLKEMPFSQNLPLGE